MILAYPQPSLTDGVVLLRPWDDGDVAVLGQASRDAYVAQIEHLPLPFSRDAGRDWIADQHARLADGSGWSFAIVELRTSEAVGGAGISFRHPPGAAEPCVWIVEERSNEGWRCVRRGCFVAGR